MPVSGCGGVVASETGLLVGESIASWSADFHLSHLSKFLRPPLDDEKIGIGAQPPCLERPSVATRVSLHGAADSDVRTRNAFDSFMLSGGSGPSSPGAKRTS